MSNVQFTSDLSLWPGLKPVVPMIVAQYATEQTHAAASTIDVAGTSIVVPKGYFSPGTTFRFTLYGSRTGTAGAATLLVVINGSTAITLAIPTNTAVDFITQFIVHEVGDFAHQQNSALCLASATVLSACDYNASTINVSEESTIKIQQTLASASDSLIIDYFLAECWKL